MLAFITLCVPSRAGHVEVVRAIYPYVAQHRDELSFEEGDTLYILEKVIISTQT